MAEIKPIRAWRYNAELANKIEDLTAPLFDVVSDKQREKLYENPFNSIHLSVPQGDHPAIRAQKLLSHWKTKGIILQDSIPCIYVYYQYFKLAGSAKEYCRKGFVCHIRAYDWKENIILRHENTIPKAVNDRINLLESTLLHASPTSASIIAGSRGAGDRDDSQLPDTRSPRHSCGGRSAPGGGARM